MDHRRFVFVLLGLTITCAALACSSSYTIPEDFTVVRNEGGSDRESRDAGAEVVVDPPGCTTLHANFTDLGQGWKYSGLADPNGTSVALTRGTGNDVGAIFLPAPPNTASFDVTFTATASGGSSPQGDGVTVVWATNTDAPGIGRGADGLGFCAGNTTTTSPVGYGLEYDLLNGALSLVWSGGGVGTCQLQGTAQMLLFTGTQTFSAHVGSTSVIATTSPGNMGTFVQTRGPSAIQWIGFTAAGGPTVIDIRDVTIRTCH